MNEQDDKLKEAADAKHEQMRIRSVRRSLGYADGPCKDWIVEAFLAGAAYERSEAAKHVCGECKHYSSCGECDNNEFPRGEWAQSAPEPSANFGCKLFELKEQND